MIFNKRPKSKTNKTASFLNYIERNKVKKRMLFNKRPKTNKTASVLN